MQKPAEGAYPAYYKTYIDLLEDDDAITVLEAGLQRTRQTFASLPEKMHNYRYAEGKWTVKELLGHMIDTERVMAYRAMCIARGEKGPLPGFAEDDYVASASFADREIQSLLEEYSNQRRANIALFNSLDEAQASREGMANGQRIQARAFPAIIAGHELHHLQVLKERYLDEA